MIALDLFPEPKDKALRLRNARKQGERRASQAEDKAVSENDLFREQARAFVMLYLKEHGPQSGEDLVDAMCDRG